MEHQVNSHCILLKWSQNSGFGLLMWIPKSLKILLSHSTLQATLCSIEPPQNIFSYFKIWWCFPWRMWSSMSIDDLSNDQPNWHMCNLQIKSIFLLYRIRCDPCNVATCIFCHMLSVIKVSIAQCLNEDDDFFLVRTMILNASHCCERVQDKFPPSPPPRSSYILRWVNPTMAWS
mgnify:CR=1 FL=1